MGQEKRSASRLVLFFAGFLEASAAFVLWSMAACVVGVLFGLAWKFARLVVSL